MSENQNCGIRDFSKYDEMTTEELEEILRLDAEMIDGQESDTEILLYVMEVLTQRKKQAGQTGNTAQEAYETFTQHYLPEIDNTDPVPSKRNKPTKCSLRWIRALAATAAVLVLLITCSVTAKAFGVDVWKAVIQWTQETFHFGEWGNSNPKDRLPYASLQEALEKGNTPAWLVPTWLPEGFKLVVVTANMTPMQKTYRAQYLHGENELIITVREYLNEEPLYVEQSEGLIEEYKVNGITYYLLENNKEIRAVWIVDSFECSIAGPVKIEEMKTMIDSITKG